MDGGSLTDALGLTIGSGATLTGSGTAGAITVAGGTITQSGGTLSLTSITGSGMVNGAPSVSGAITASGGTLDLTGTPSFGSLAIDSGSVSDLLINGTATASTAIAIDNANQTLEIGAAGALTINAAESITNGKIQLDGGSLTDALGLTIGSGATLTGSGTAGAITVAGGTITQSGGTLSLTSITGSGMVNGAPSVSGAITASGGTLDLTGTPSFGSLAIDSGSVSDLLINGTATASTAIAIDNANQTLEIGAAGALTINAAESITNGKIQLDGGSLTDALGLTIGSGATLTGSGTAGAITVAGGTITQSGGTLSLTSITGSGMVNGAPSVSGAITASGGTLDLTGTPSFGSLAIDSGSVSDLLINGTATASTAIAIDNANQTLEIGAAGALTINAAESITNGKIQLDGGSLTDALGLTIGSGATLTGSGTAGAITVAGGTITQSGGTLSLTSITGSGMVNGAPSVSGAITASGGTLEVTGTPNFGSLAIDSLSASVLLLDNTLSSGAIAIDNANQTLEIGTGGALTISATESITNGTIRLDGSSLSDASGLTIGSGATLTGSGTVNAAITGSGGTITASGGTLDLIDSVAIGQTFTIGTASPSALLIDGTASAGTSIILDNANQTLEIGAAGALTVSVLETVNGGTLRLDAGGSALFANGGLTVSSGTFTQTDGATSVTGAASFSGGTATISNGTFDAGTLTVTGTTLTLGSGTLTTTIDDSTSNSIGLGATISLGGGTLDYTNAGGSASGGVTDSGTLFGLGTIDGILAGSGTVEASGGTLTLHAASIASSMNLFIDAGASLISAGTGNSGTYTLRGTNSALSLGGNLATGTVNFDGVSSDRETLDLTSATLLGSVGAITGFSFSDTIRLTGFATATHAEELGGSLLLEDSSDAVLYTITSFGKSDPAAPVAFSNTGGVVTLTLGADADNNFLYATTGGDGNFPTAYAWSTFANWDLGQPQTGQSLDLATNFAPGQVSVDDIASLSVASLIPSSGLFIIDSGATLTVGTGGILAPGTVEIIGTLTINTLSSILSGETILMAGGTLNSPAGGTDGDASTTLSGRGFVNGGEIRGTGTIIASGGTLSISNAIASGSVLQIDSGSISDLLINGTAITGTAIAIDNANQTLEIGAAGALTINAAESITNGTIRLDGGSLTDALGLTIGSGATLTGSGTAGAITVAGGTITQSGGTLSLTSITGSGMVNGAPSVSGAITASGGTLEVIGNLDASTGLNFQIDNATLQIDGTIGASNQFSFVGPTGDLIYNNVTTGISEIVIGLNIGTSNTIPTNLINFKAYAVSISGGNAFTGQYRDHQPIRRLRPVAERHHRGH